MGAWGAGVFENDDAMDWTYELEEATDLTVLQEPLAIVLEEQDYLESPDCCNALAAAEVVAELKGPTARDLPEEVSAYIKRVKTVPSPELIGDAVSAVVKIKGSSELKELWEESESSEEWLAVVNDLLSRLQKT